MPPFFFARPRRWILRPRSGLAPVISQTRLINRIAQVKRGAETGGHDPGGQGETWKRARVVRRNWRGMLKETVSRGERVQSGGESGVGGTWVTGRDGLGGEPMSLGLLV